jgi:hypothetical protein
MAVGISEEGYRYEAILDNGIVEVGILTSTGEWFTFRDKCGMAEMLGRLHVGSWRDIAMAQGVLIENTTTTEGKK